MTEYISRNIKEPKNYLYTVQDSNNFSINNITVESISNGKYRDFVFVNKKQCKYIPCKPTDMLQMCTSLYELTIAKTSFYNSILVIGFAETDTGISNIIARQLPNCKYVMNTTKEVVSNSRELVRLKEKSSSALYTHLNTSITFDKFDYILFVTDEVSKGNDILNFIEHIKNIETTNSLKFGIASVCNWQIKENKEMFSDNGIDTFYLVSGDMINSIKSMGVKNNHIKTSTSLLHPSDIIYKLIRLKKSDIEKSNVFDFRYSKMYNDNRLGHTPDRNIPYIHDIVNSIKVNVKDKRSTIRLIGTEEFTEIPIIIGGVLENMGYSVICQSTNQTPINVVKSVFDGTSDGIKSAYPLSSAYNENKTSYIYNLDENTDYTVVITDTVNNESFNKFKISLLKVLKLSNKLFRAENVMFFRY